MVESAFKYRGRIPVRSDGKARREALLEATLALIISDGIRGVRHRAVAEKANVPLAATTYYFDDIFDLIHDAFIYFSEKAMSDIRTFEKEAFGILDKLSKNQLPRNELITLITNYTTDYIIQQSSKSDFRILEHTFRTQALRDERIAQMVKIVETEQLNTIMAFLKRLSVMHCETRARIIFTTIIRLEYELTLRIIAPEQVRDTIKETLTLVLS
jgi:DNA-binding transcriptional regulator YbjK